MKTATYVGLQGHSVVVEYDENAPCRICGKPVVEASMGGTDVCSWCDTGFHRDGRRWTYRDLMHVYQQTRRNSPN